MDRTVLLKYCELLKDLGMLFEDDGLIERLDKNFQSNYHSFELHELFQLMRLGAYCFYKPPKLLELLYDSIAIRALQDEQIQKLQCQDTLAFIEALTVNSIEHRGMSSLLAKILKKTGHLNDSHETSQFALCYLADFDLKVSKKLAQSLQDSLLHHLTNKSHSTKDLVYLLLAVKQQGNMREDGGDQLSKIIEDQITERIQSSPAGEEANLKELLALVHPGFPLKPEEAEVQLRDIESGSNIVELLESMFRGRKIEKNVLLCRGRVPASLLVDDRHVVQLLENVAVHYRKGDDQYRKMARARQAEALIKDELGPEASYYGISYVEMEYAVNEAEYLEQVLHPILQQKKINEEES